VIAPDRATLLRWQEEQRGVSGKPQEHPEGTVVDIRARQILWQGNSLPLSQLEFQVLQTLLEEPGRALSFRELRRIGWGDGPEMPVDPYTVKALVQRLRAKLGSCNAPVEIEAVRGFGFRAVEKTTAIRSSSLVTETVGSES
jgi:DNA-binding response OmpR family regulator